MVTSGNPVFPGWYADPELHLFQEKYWIYPTTSAPYEEQTYFEAFSSPDLVNWTNEGRILDFSDVPWSTNRAAWAPSCAQKDGRYYFYFSAGDGAGLGVGVSDSAGGPFHDPLGKPLVRDYLQGAQPIDAHAFVDEDGEAYLYWGGWGHCVVCRLGQDMISLVGEVKEITPDHYVEGPFMAKRKGIYYLMWSEGNWGDRSYRIAYARADNPFGPFEREGEIFENESPLASSAGHHSVLNIPGTDDWILAYHRRPFGETCQHHRVVCLEQMNFEKDGSIRPIVLSQEGVTSRPILGNMAR